MADKKISELTPLTGANLADNDEFAVVDTSAVETKAITFGELKTALDTSTGFVRITGDTMTGGLTVPTVDINGGTIDGTVIGGSTPAAISGTTGSFSGLSVSSVENISITQIHTDGNTVTFTQSGTGGDIDWRNANGAALIRTADANRFLVASNGDISFYEDTGTTPKFFWDASAEGLAIGSTTVANGAGIDVVSAGTRGAVIKRTNINPSSGTYTLEVDNSAQTSNVTAAGALKVTNSNGSGMFIDGKGDVSLYDDSGAVKFFWDASAESLGIGTSSPGAKLDVAETSSTNGGKLRLSNLSTNISTGGTAGEIEFYNQDASSGAGVSGFIKNVATNAGQTYALTFGSGFAGGTTERMRIDPSGNLLVGTTTTGSLTEGFKYESGSKLFRVVRSNASPFAPCRIGSDGSIVEFQKDGTTVGSIGAFTVATSAVFFGSLDTALLANSGNDSIHPWNASTNSNRDNAIDLGNASNRFDDIFATNGTIQTSDRNEKQDIEELTEAEQRVAVACKGLLRKFRWKDAVAEKGDDARIHFGIIAQDLQAAFEAEGLDAGRYAMFISSTWWEAQVERTREVEQEDGTTATETYTVTETYEEPTEGATERTRMGVRYPELLAFIIAAI